jgi:probable LLM family oxidoreductase
MEIGIGMFGDLQIAADGTIQSAQSRLSEIIDEVILMDELGLDFFGMGEHHRPDYAVSSPEMLLAAVASRTKNIKLGSAVSVLSSSDPVSLYQRFALLDLISKGRAELMAGRGSFIESFPLFGLNLADYDSLFDEKLKLLLAINEQEKITWSGRFRPTLKEQVILPRAVNNHLDIWVAVGGTPASVLRAGKLGLPVMFAIIGGNPAQFKPLFEYYEQAYLDSGHDKSKLRVGVHLHSLIGECSTEIADYYYPVYQAQMDRIGKERGWPPYQRQSFDLGRQKNGHLVVGDVNEAVDKILHLHEIFGITRFSAHIDVGAPSHHRLMKSIELYGDKIAPAVRKALRS